MYWSWININVSVLIMKLWLHNMSRMRKLQERYVGTSCYIYTLSKSFQKATLKGQLEHQAWKWWCSLWNCNGENRHGSRHCPSEPEQMFSNRSVQHGAHFTGQTSWEAPGTSTTMSGALTECKRRCKGGKAESSLMWLKSFKWEDNLNSQVKETQWTPTELTRKCFQTVKPSSWKGAVRHKSLKHLRGGESCYYRDNMAADGFH